METLTPELLSAREAIRKKFEGRLGGVCRLKITGDWPFKADVLVFDFFAQPPKLQQLVVDSFGFGPATKQEGKRVVPFGVVPYSSVLKRIQAQLAKLAKSPGAAMPKPSRVDRDFDETTTDLLEANPGLKGLLQTAVLQQPVHFLSYNIADGGVHVGEIGGLGVQYAPSLGRLQLGK